MKTIYIDCSMGIAGDMLMACLYELIEDKDSFIDRLNSVGLTGVSVVANKLSKCGIMGTSMTVTVNGLEEFDHHDNHHPNKEDHSHGDDNHSHADNHHNHTHSAGHSHKVDSHIMHENGHHHHESRNIEDIATILGRLNIPDKVRSDAIAIYNILANAESKVHGKPVSQIHFHEVGNLDAIADITGVCMLFYDLGDAEIIASPICTGSGFVKCAHGKLPVPAPATAEILKGIPIYSGDIYGELCTPTGAAIIKYFANQFISMPPMEVSKIGYGMGKKDFEKANCVRAFLGDRFADSANASVAELICNIDDMTGEAIGFVCGVLAQEGARDVFLTPIQMKKNRPAFMLTVLCDIEKSDFFAALIFKHTTTIGIRKNNCERYTLERRVETLKTPHGDIKIKVCEGYGVKKIKPEYDDIESLALKNNASFEEILKSINIDC